MLIVNDTLQMEKLQSLLMAGFNVEDLGDRIQYKAKSIEYYSEIFRMHWNNFSNMGIL